MAAAFVVALVATPASVDDAAMPTTAATSDTTVAAAGPTTDPTSASTAAPGSSTAPVGPSTTTVEPVEERHGNSVFCGPTVQVMTKQEKLVVSVIQRTDVAELRPPCDSIYGRRSTGEKVFTGQGTIDEGTVRDNRTMLAASLANGWLYYVDDVRFLSSDPLDVRAGFEDYADYLYSGAFGIELQDEPTVAVLDEFVAVLRRLDAELARRNAATDRAVELATLVRPSVNYVVGSDVVVPAIRAVLGPHARFSIDAYTLDEAIWDELMGKLFGIVDHQRAPGTSYDIHLTVPISRWSDAATGEPRSPEVTEASILAYLRIAASFQSAGVSGVMFFTGFAAADNVFADHFVNTLLEKRVLGMVLAALEEYRTLLDG